VRLQAFIWWSLPRSVSRGITFSISRSVSRSHTVCREPAFAGLDHAAIACGITDPQAGRCAVALVPEAASSCLRGRGGSSKIGHYSRGECC
jgi:hypothetical protein